MHFGLNPPTRDHTQKVRCAGCGEETETYSSSKMTVIPRGWLRMTITGRVEGGCSSDRRLMTLVCTSMCAADVLAPIFEREQALERHG